MCKILWLIRILIIPLKVLALLISITCLWLHWGSLAATGRKENLLLGGTFVAYTIIGSMVISEIFGLQSAGKVQKLVFNVTGAILFLAASSVIGKDHANCYGYCTLTVVEQYVLATASLSFINGILYGVIAVLNLCFKPAATTNDKSTNKKVASDRPPTSEPPATEEEPENPVVEDELPNDST